MKKMTYEEINQIQGGDLAWDCFAYGFGFGLGLASGTPIGLVGAGFVAVKAYEAGCFG